MSTPHFHLGFGFKTVLTYSMHIPRKPDPCPVQENRSTAKILPPGAGRTWLPHPRNKCPHENSAEQQQAKIGPSVLCCTQSTDEASTATALQMDPSCEATTWTSPTPSHRNCTRPAILKDSEANSTDRSHVW